VLDFFRPVPKKRTIKFKNRNGIIFYNPSLLGKTLFHIGNLLLIGGLLYAGYLYYPLATAIIDYWNISKNQGEVAIVKPSLVPTLVKTGIIAFASPTPVPTVIKIGTTEYSINVPRIGAIAAIVKNVSPFDQKEYSNILKDHVVAQAKGSDDVNLGAGKSTFIFAHSTEQSLRMIRQNSTFYLLGQLKNGDEVVINEMGNLLKYKVYMQKIVNADEIKYLKYSDPNREVLILQTCWPIGTAWKRLLVFAERI
jgi:LPXTG-site transpeptidase (sortase) family protein